VQHAGVRAWFADPASRADGEHTTVGADNGRIETRHHAVNQDVGWMLSDRCHPDEAPMPGLAMLGMVESTMTRDGETSTERRLYLSSASSDAMAFAAAVRAHWRIENCPRWVPGVGFDEDRARNRKDHGPENLTIVRKLALNVFRTARPDISIRRKRKRPAGLPSSLAPSSAKWDGPG
jgi:predicted transposase YbfD/YdcC